jgi:hypothetical protein
MKGFIDSIDQAYVSLMKTFLYSSPQKFLQATSEIHAAIPKKVGGILTSHTHSCFLSQSSSIVLLKGGLNRIPLKG